MCLTHCVVGVVWVVAARGSESLGEEVRASAVQKMPEVTPWRADRFIGITGQLLVTHKRDRARRRDDVLRCSQRRVAK